MKYALGNMLNGAGGLNADGLALDLQFAADKTLTARRGPSPILTRTNNVATFVGSNGLIQSAGTDIPRFDHDPVSPFACRGLLIEEGRANLLVQSENLGTTWTSVNLNQTGTPPYLNVATAPDGATTADKLIATTTNGTHQFRQSVTLVSGTSYTISVYFKAAETNFAAISVFGVANGSADWDAFFNISASSPAAGQSLGFTSTSLVDVGNGWRRCSVTFTATASGSLSVRLGGATSTNLNSNSYTGDGTSGFLLWGAQLEAGSFATSYIPTTTSALARSADVCSITGDAFNSFYNQSEGSLACNYSIITGFTGNRYAASIEDAIGGTQNGFTLRNTNSSTSFIAGAGYASTIGSVTTGVSKHILAYSGLTEFVYVKDSVVGTVTGSGTRNPSLPIRMSIGGLEEAFPLCGHIAAIRYYKKRLQNAKLQALTA